MSAEIDLFPWVISLILRGGTAMSFASLYSLSLSGFRNSSDRISPGWTGLSLCIGFY